ncbi:MAG: aa3-type cytochrome c oxidase subunit IV [Dinoroseobacter sp.]|nr:aa3-type cytochrome c oxidase subunit IV [Dinoroseobacter sp.]NQZ72041.1 aa3-type cytochrome c oxidase subunit IV [Dinoroseobacter sp.]
MAEHKHGSMDTTEQEKTFDGFMRFSIWTVVVIIVALILLAMINA